MAKTIWIRAICRGCAFNAGKLELDASCGHYQASGDLVFSEPVLVHDIGSLLCFAKGMVNSSLNALVQIGDGWGPLGKLTNKMEVRHGVTVKKIVNDFSRDGDIECVESKEDAEKLCLLEQKFPGCQPDILEIAKENAFDIDRISARSLRALKHAVESRLRNYAISAPQLAFDPQVKTLILAGAKK